jgi:ABC-type dipeptide/oligopeptide/nickel transport system ATPase component
MLIDHINHRFKKGLGTTIYVIGLSGTGKSSSSIRIGELVKDSRKKETSLKIVDSLLKLLQAIRKSKPGDIIIVEEISVLFPSRRAMSKDNVYIGRVMDTLRKKQICLISNAPLWNTIDKHMKAMGNVLIETLLILKKEEIVISKYHLLQTNPKTGETYYHTFQDKQGYNDNRLFTRMPLKERWDTYEKEKDEFMDKIYLKMEKENQIREQKEDKRLGLQKPNSSLDTLSKKYKEIWYKHSIEEKNQQQIAEEMGVSQSRISQILIKIRKIV